MYVKSSLLLAVISFFTASSLSTDCLAQNNPNYQKTRTRPVIPFKHTTLAAPPGMVYIPGGSVTIKYSQSSTDTNSKKRVSLSSFYIDKTEVTNQQYRMFTEWVIDSLAVVNYLKDDKYFLDPNPNGDEKKDENSKKEADAKPIEVAKVDSVKDSTGAMVAVTPTVTATPAATTTTTLAATPAVKKDSIRRRINWANVKHDELFNSNDDEIKRKLMPLYDPNTGKIKEEFYVYNFTYLRATGTNKNVKVGEYTTEPVNIYPDEKIWFKDLSNSQVEILVENYFTQPPFDDYPVVGVNWKQARAFAHWRSNTNSDYAYIADYLKYYRLTYSLPSEAQWVYAAGEDIQQAGKSTQQVVDEKDKADLSKEEKSEKGSKKSEEKTASVTDSAAVTPAITDSAAMAANGSADNGKKAEEKKAEEPQALTSGPVDSTPVERDRDGKLLVNFKQEEGNYTDDGANFTLPVMSYAPNKFGVYNMVGNVSEWVLDAYSPSTFAFVSDVNPVLLYDADSTDSEAMKRKVVRGGSFVSNAKALSPFSRDQEQQNTAHCFIGFRCVMPAPEILTRSVATRRNNTGTDKRSTIKKHK